MVTGGTGFVGFSLVKRLIRMGCKVKVVTRGQGNVSDFKQFVKHTPENRLSVHQADLSSLRQMEPLFADVDYVFHAAALVNSSLPYEEFYRANVLATENICHLSLKKNIKKLIYVSTSDVFGLPEQGEIFTEKSPYKYWSEPYADTKIDATNRVRQSMKNGLVTTIIYPGWVYGPGDRAFFPAILKQLKSGIMPVWDKEPFNISFVYISDLTDALVDTLTVSKSDNEDFIILDDTSGTTMKDLCRMLGQLFKIKFRTIPVPYSSVYLGGWVSQKLYQMKWLKSPVITTTDVKSFGHPFRFSSSKAEKILNWKVKTPLEKGAYHWKVWYRYTLNS